MLRSVPSAIDDALDTLYEPNSVLSQFLGSASMTFLFFSSRFAREERAKCRAANRCPTAIQQYCLTPTASRESSTKTIKSTRLTIRRRTRKTQTKKSQVEKRRFRPAEPDCVRNGFSITSSSVFSTIIFL